VESIAREILAEGASKAGPFGIDFERLARHKKALGITEDWPEWTEDMDDPAFSRRVLGLEG